MARRKPNQPTGEIKLELGELYPKQWQFIESKTRYTAYGGARGGGKTHVLIRACIRGALQYPGIKILILRRTYPELEQTIIQPMNKLVNSATMDGRPCGDLIATYNGTMRMLFFANGSTVKFGHLQSAAAITEYQGQEYDWIFMDEATHFTEYEFRTMGATLRGVNEIPKHFYLTCNPGGVGHQWVKRLFVTREYEGVESGRDYSFIPATVEDNKELLKASPEYIQMLDTLPEDIRAAHRYPCSLNVDCGLLGDGFQLCAGVLVSHGDTSGGRLAISFALLQILCKVLFLIFPCGDSRSSSIVSGSFGWAASARFSISANFFE